MFVVILWILCGTTVPRGPHYLSSNRSHAGSVCLSCQLRFWYNEEKKLNARTEDGVYTHVVMDDFTIKSKFFIFFPQNNNNNKIEQAGLHYMNFLLYL